jgi:SAM-dependent methyltransferase
VTAPPGGRVIEIGCGYGKLISSDPQKSRLAVGLDDDYATEVEGKKLWGKDAPAYVCGSTFKLPFADRSFHTVILRESLHHFRNSEGVVDALTEITRICSHELIVFDPNVHLPLKIARRLVKHEDEICNWPEAVEALQQVGFKVKELRFRDLLAFPLSGGLVGPEFLKANTSMWRLALRTDEAARRMLDHVPALQRRLCWRYLLVAVRAA